MLHTEAERLGRGESSLPRGPGVTCVVPLCGAFYIFARSRKASLCASLPQETLKTRAHRHTPVTATPLVRCARPARAAMGGAQGPERETRRKRARFAPSNTHARAYVLVLTRCAPVRRAAAGLILGLVSAEGENARVRRGMHRCSLGGGLAVAARGNDGAGG